ncbi:glycosyltransferase, partial [Bacillus cereus]
EGYPITIVEARSLQKVIIASDIPSMREQIRDGENGYLCPLDVMQFADKIQKVLADQEGRDAVRKKLREEPIDFSAGYAQIEAFAKK